MRTVISVEHLSKEYRLGVINHGMLYKDIQSWLAKKFGKPDPHAQLGDERYLDQEDRFWALKDLCFNIEQGDRVGIIGKNGAGKSTLLKILSRITSPTEGIVKIKGRVVSLLEVGTGFHGELTGRENIYLNGAILGMKKCEIDRKLDEIIAFSEIEQHIDTPVKRYSSGMYVRLAFSVAAHLDSEILIADEVLAVGDVIFQKKAIGKMHDISSGDGRTVLFVSHNLAAVEQLCLSGMLLEHGRMDLFSSDIEEVIKKYQKPNSEGIASVWENNENEFASEFFTLQKMYITDEKGEIVKDAIRHNSSFSVNFEFSVSVLDPSLEISYEVFDQDGKLVFVSQQTDLSEDQWPKIKKGENKVKTTIPSYLLNEGEYYIKPGAYLYKRKILIEPRKINIGVVVKIEGGLSESPYWQSRRGGQIAPHFNWTAC